MISKNSRRIPQWFPNDADDGAGDDEDVLGGVPRDSSRTSCRFPNDPPRIPKWFSKDSDDDDDGVLRGMPRDFFRIPN